MRALQADLDCVPGEWGVEFGRVVLELRRDGNVRCNRGLCARR